MDRRESRLALAVVRHPWRVLAILTLLTVAASGFALRVETDLSPDDLHRSLGDQQVIDRRFEDRFGRPDHRVVVLVEGPDMTEPAQLEALRTLHGRLLALPSVTAAQSLASLPLISGQDQGPGRVATAEDDLLAGRLRIEPALGNGPIDGRARQRLLQALRWAPLAEGALLSRDRRSALVVVDLHPAALREGPLAEAVADIEAVTRDMADRHGLDIALSGHPYLRTWISAQISRDQGTLFPGAIAVALLLLLLTFRWWPALVLPAAAVGLSAAWLVGLMGVVGEPINIINNIVPVLIIIVGISDSIHLINRYGEELERGAERSVAVARALTAMALALLLTSATTAAGFASLVTSTADILRRFGVTAAVGMLLAYAVTITLLPAVLVRLPVPRRALAHPEHGLFERWTARWVARLLGRSRIVLAASALFLCACVAVALRMPVDYRQADQYDIDQPIFRTLQRIDEKLLGVQTVELMVTSSDPAALGSAAVLQAFDDAAQTIRRSTDVAHARGFTDELRQMWMTIERREDAFAVPLSRAPVDELTALAVLGGRAASTQRAADGSLRLTLHFRDIGGRRILAAAREAQAAMDEALAEVPGVNVELSGESYVAARGLLAVTGDLLASLVLASVVILVFLTLAFRSLRLGLLSLPPNLLPLVATMTYMQLRGITLNPGTVIIFSVSIGLAVDGTIHVLARFREALAAGLSRDAALGEATTGTGKAILVSYGSLVLGFGLFQLSGFVPIRLFGELVSVTVLGCMVSTLVVLPPLIRTFWPR